MIYDTHCHPYLAKNKSQDDIIHNITLSGGFLNCIGVDIESSKKSIALAKEHKNVFATIGIHPCDIIQNNTFLDLEKTIKNLEKLYKENPEHIVGIGETGFDFYWLESQAKKMLNQSLSKKTIVSLQEQDLEEKHVEKISSQIKSYQELFFKAQIELAKTYNLPLVIHNRNSKEDVLRVLKETNFKNFIFHCYSEDLEYARNLLEHAPDCFLSFSGIVTFKNAKPIQETAANIPLKNIIIETDSPYLTPEPFRGREENEPIFVQHVLEKILELRGEESEEISNTILENSKRLFIQKKGNS